MNKKVFKHKDNILQPLHSALCFPIFIDRNGSLKHRYIMGLLGDDEFIKEKKTAQNQWFLIGVNLGNGQF